MLGSQHRHLRLLCLLPGCLLILIGCPPPDGDSGPVAAFNATTPTRYAPALPTSAPTSPPTTPLRKITSLSLCPNPSPKATPSHLPPN